MINFVSNLPRDLRSGGFSAMSAAAFDALSKRHLVRYVGPINPPASFWRKALSKLLRVSGGRGDFFFFSEARLEAIERAVRARCEESATLDFFHGFTPWIRTQTGRPYVAWSDCTFRDYIDIYHRREMFRDRDLERIERAEAAWLGKARRVLFRSRWAAERAVADYRLDAGRVRSVGSFGEMEMPAQDAYSGEKSFVFVSTDFAAKGGAVALAAFRQIKARHPDASLAIVGDRPSPPSEEPGVKLVGFLRKEVPAEVQGFRRILSRARALLHPTTSDVSPLIIIEAAYFGCPAISSRRFAIPELVDDDRTGILLDDPSRIDALVAAMERVLDRQDEYRAMRLAAWRTARERYSRHGFEERLLSEVSQALSVP